MGFAMRLVGSYVVAFFLAGAVLLAALHPGYALRAVLTLGLVAASDGVESVLRAGHVDKCSLWGSCNPRSVRTGGFVLWALLFGYWTWRSAGREPPAMPGPAVDRSLRFSVDDLPDGRMARVGIALAAVAVVAVLTTFFVGLVAPFTGRPARSAESPSTAPATAAPPAARYGLTFAIARTGPRRDATGFACDGAPAPTDHPRAGTCDPETGDTDCRTPLPIACLDEATGAIGTTPPIDGASLASGLAASDRCRAHLGSTWRMARFHDRGGGPISGPPAGAVAADTRAWVRIDDRKANCWDPAR